MTTFKRIHHIVSIIPKGQVLSYGDVARLASTTPRVVGFALHANPDPKNVPCHRVVFKDGRLAPGYVFGGLTKQKELLEKEGVKIVGNRVSLAKMLSPKMGE